MKKSIKQAKKKINKFVNKGNFIFPVLIGVVVILFLIILGTSQNDTSNSLYELTEVDLFSLEDFNANDVSVLGLAVGDRDESLLNHLGMPDIRNDFPGGVSSLEYSEGIGLEETGLIVLMDNGIVTRITVKPAFNEFLVGSTNASISKEGIYSIFGVPEETVRMPIKQDSSLIVKSLRYDSKGLDFTVRKSNSIGFSLNLNDPESS